MAKKQNRPSTTAGNSPKKARVAIRREVEKEVLTKCLRRCCMCYFLNKKEGPVDGQIAHLDQDNTNPDADNLAYLCLECHKNYDRKSNRVTGYTRDEIKHYRDLLHRALRTDQVEWLIRVRTSGRNYAAVKVVIDAAVAELKKATPDVNTQEGSGA